MQIVKIELGCPHCKNTVPVEMNLWTGEHKVLGVNKKKADPVQLFRVVNRFRELKSFTEDQIPGWTKSRAGKRAFAAAKELVTFFVNAQLEDPSGVALECLEGVAAAAKLGSWEWTLETVVKRADEWLASKQKGVLR